MTKEEMKEKIAQIRAKGYLDDTDRHHLWEIHKATLGQFQGNLGCIDCIREAVRRLTIYFETNE